MLKNVLHENRFFLKIWHPQFFASRTIQPKYVCTPTKNKTLYEHFESHLRKLVDLLFEPPYKQILNGIISLNSGLLFVVFI